MHLVAYAFASLKSHPFIIHQEFNFIILRAHKCSFGCKEWSSKNDGDFLIYRTIKDDKVEWKKELAHSHKHIINNTYRSLTIWPTIYTSRSRHPWSRLLVNEKRHDVYASTCHTPTLGGVAGIQWLTVPREPHLKSYSECTEDWANKVVIYLIIRQNDNNSYKAHKATEWPSEVHLIIQPKKGENNLNIYTHIRPIRPLYGSTNPHRGRQGHTW